MEPSDLMKRLTQSPLDAKALDAIALDVVCMIDDMGPLHLPPKPVTSAELSEVLERTRSVPEHLQAEFCMYLTARDKRIDVREENARRQRTLLWAEKRLREHGYAEHEIIAAYLHDIWGME